MSADIIKQIIIGIFGLLTLVGGGFLTYHFGTKQGIAAQIDKTNKEAANQKIAANAQATTAEAAQTNADAAMQSALRQTGVDSLKMLMESGTSIANLTKQLQEYGSQLGEVRTKYAEDLGKIREKHLEEINGIQQTHQREINELRTDFNALLHQVDILRREIALKDAVLADCEDCRKEKQMLLNDTQNLHREMALKDTEIRELKQAKEAFLFLWEAASDANEGRKVDPGHVNIAEAAIRRTIFLANQEKSEAAARMSTGIGNTTVQVTTTVTTPDGIGPIEVNQTGHDSPGEST